jgi:hypothetical protein
MAMPRVLPIRRRSTSPLTPGPGRASLLQPRPCGRRQAAPKPTLVLSLVHRACGIAASRPMQRLMTALDVGSGQHAESLPDCRSVRVLDPVWAAGGTTAVMGAGTCTAALSREGDPRAGPPRRTATPRQRCRACAAGAPPDATDTERGCPFSRTVPQNLAATTRPLPPGFKDF